MADPFALLRGNGGVTDAASNGRWHRLHGDILDVLRERLGELATTQVAGLPPFQGGAAGYLGYEFATAIERVPRATVADLPFPDALFGLYDWALAWDHVAARAWLVSTGLPLSGSEREARARQRLEDVLGILHAPVAPSEGLPFRPVHQDEVVSTLGRERYLRAVERIIGYIFDGDIFQANLSHRLSIPLPTSPFEFYSQLRHHNPAPFGAYWETDVGAILSSSPERFLHVEAETGLVETRPIKGTRPRGPDAHSDEAYAQALRESGKDRAENVMIVDLLRNDLSRVCRAGSLRVPSLLALERHPTVHHLVSTVTGRLEEGEDATSLLRATFPGGSITGAPKIRAMEIIAELEPTQRSVYCGTIAYLSVTGAMDSSVAIRTGMAVGGRLYLSAGGGIVAQSEPEAEYRETMAKAKSFLECAAGAGHAGVSRP